MNANDYQNQVARTLIHEPDAEYSPHEIMLVWCALKLAGEAGEVANYIGKGVFHQHGISDDPLIEELGDVLWYVVAICTLRGLSMDAVMQANIDKLIKRYPNGWSSSDSIARLE